jgi:hypothetical protein
MFATPAALRDAPVRVPELIPIEHAWIDSSRAPLYMMTFPVVTLDEDLRACCDARERWAKIAKYPVSWVVDLSAITNTTAKQRRIFSEHLARFEPHDRAYNRGSALIVPNAFLRGVVTAVFWLKPPTFPNECFATKEEALRWARIRLREGTSATETG